MEKHRWQEWLLGYRRTWAIQVIYMVYLYGEYGLTKSWWQGNSPWTLAVHRPDSYRCPMSLACGAGLLLASEGASMLGSCALYIMEPILYFLEKAGEGPAKSVKGRTDLL